MLQLPSFFKLITSGIVALESRPAGSGSEGMNAVDDDSVELEKSNILLMGPTGSGLHAVLSNYLSKILLISVSLIAIFPVHL